MKDFKSKKKKKIL